MPNPKHRHSKQRRNKRRTHYKATVPSTSTCSNCGAVKIPHRVCPECGYYRGKLAVEKKTASA
jgi:large subunit ribosomal protein L32